MKVEKLTQEQIDKLPEYKQKWLDIGLSTQKADRVLAEKAVDEAYEKAGLKAPKVKIWLMSPFQGVIGAEYLRLLVEKLKITGIGDQVGAQVWAQVGAQVWDQVGAQVWDQVWDQVGGQVGAQVRAQVGAQVRDQVRVQVWAQVWEQVRDQVWAQVGDQVGDQVRDQVGAQVRDQVGDQRWRAGYGLHDANWLGFYDFFKEQLNLEPCYRLAPMMRLAEHCGWWWPFEGAVILTEKPTSILRDQNNRLHSMDKAALSYHDGWGIYAIHGVRVPEKYILTSAEEINPEEVMKETNAEIRMAVIRKCGFVHFKNNLEHKVISSSHGNELLEFSIEGEKVRGLKVSWMDKHSFKETILPVARTKTEFKSWARQIGVDFIPDDIDDCEQVRKFTIKMRPNENFLLET